jgi:dTDP-glucose pyrophosphorylase
MNVFFLMAGAGKRFADVGYKEPKPFIPMNGKRMIDVVLENFHQNNQELIKANYVFFCLRSFLDQYYDEFISCLNKHGIHFQIVNIGKVTEGAVCTALVAKELINSEELLITDCDHLQLDQNSFLNGINYFRKYGAVGGTWTHYANDIKWSFCRLNDRREVIEVKEKEIVSNFANTGTYYFKYGNDFIRSAEEMISNNDRVKNEFYVAPTLNYLIKEGQKVLPYMINDFKGLGTPTDLEDYLFGDKE